ncbi:hypothetical protein ACL02S_24020 [Nocardia sp. 004]|uniref:hypothetical protein n=1 Tax=Nocardia sp. 004 TaxID=3385978 RepID=UPI00399F3E60
MSAPQPADPVVALARRHHDLVGVSVWTGDDGATVVQIDTAENAGRLRVAVNDGAVFDGIVFDARPDHGDHHPVVIGYAARVVAALARYAAEVADAVGRGR